ncbi:TPA: helix-turn-helix domain-containing protein [Photobacterium damselae]|uniref:Transcriptional regulator n=1 Tax=Photobacterium damselae TaxID=38293 RepID=A0ABD6X855_PHODM|nr:helix-turn-helix transcriptional regulator [Photobacterium damselae]MCG3845969.1 helix-turn-helix transcriptional regulator [Photobacterium damselae]OBU43982.1 transcriptional regulator [Photobacterium damselae]PSU18875.1 transcriptional regulator [Photobacterium damselae]UJZ95874.1 helix-turn-helix transcriptional regulator [Photobacterium damselae subsp. damselae]UKA00221.1 helix-turn-helix transcriptional regulator [Photobacterium damselae subsp. damselae]
MTIRINLDVMMAKRKMRLKTLAKEVEITEANLSVLKNGKAKAIRFSTLEKLCAVLDCQPGDILEFDPSDDDQIES